MKDKRKNLQSSWWNRIIWRQKPDSEIIDLVYPRKDVTAEDLLIHDEYFNKLRVVAPILNLLNKRQFSKSEFNLFVFIKYKLAQKQGDYRYYNQIWNLVALGIKLKDSYEKIANIEFDNPQKYERQFYQDVLEILETTSDSDIFENIILQKFNRVYRNLDNDNAKKLLLTYQQESQKIARNGQKALNLFLWHKQTKFNYINTFNQLAELINNLSQDIQQIKNKIFLLEIINNNYRIFSQLSSFLKIRETYQDFSHHLLMLQYLILTNVYQEDYQQFRQFLKHLKEWHKDYQTILAIRNKYPISEYKQPASFLKEIGGEEIYTKYKSYLQNFSQD